MNTLQMGWRRIAARILAADRLTRVKRWAALALAASFFLPLYSCTAQATKEPPAAKAVAPQAAVMPAVAPRHVDFTPAESYAMASWEGGLVVSVFAWPLLLQGAAVLAGVARQRLALGWTEVLLCVASGAGIGWALWFGAHMPGFAPEVGAVLAAGALAAYLGAAIAGLRSSR